MADGSWRGAVSAADVATVNAFTDVPIQKYNASTTLVPLDFSPAFQAKSSGPISAQCINTHASAGATFQLLGTQDKNLASARWVVVDGPTGQPASTTIAALELRRIIASMAFYKVQVKSTTADTASTVIVYIGQHEI